VWLEVAMNIRMGEEGRPAFERLDTRAAMLEQDFLKGVRQSELGVLQSGFRGAVDMHVIGAVERFLDTACPGRTRWSTTTSTILRDCASTPDSA
jgi:hypothetical protein